MLALGRQAFGRNECSCSMFVKVKVGPLRSFAKEKRIETKHVLDGKRKEMDKKGLLLVLCRRCTSAEDVARAMDGAGWRHGIAPMYWNYVVDRDRPLSVLDAFHLRFSADVDRVRGGTWRQQGPVQAGAAPSPARVAEAADILDEFRAHSLRNVEKNFLFYVVRGRQNKVDGVGYNKIPNLAERESNWFDALMSTLRHYRDDHRDRTCGRLRKNQQCVPFRKLQECPPVVEEVLRHELLVLVSFIGAVQGRVTSVTAPFPDQAALRAHFALG